MKLNDLIDNKSLEELLDKKLFRSDRYSVMLSKIKLVGYLLLLDRLNKNFMSDDIRNKLLEVKRYHNAKVF